MIEPSRDEDRIEFKDVYITIARIKLKQIEKGKTKGYIQKKVAKPLNSCLYTLYKDSIYQEGIYIKCIEVKCFKQLSTTSPFPFTFKFF